MRGERKAVSESLKLQPAEIRREFRRQFLVSTLGAKPDLGLSHRFPFNTAFSCRLRPFVPPSSPFFCISTAVIDFLAGLFTTAITTYEVAGQLAHGL